MSNELHQDYRLELIYNKIRSHKVLIFVLFIALTFGSIFQSFWHEHSLEQGKISAAKFDSYMNNVINNKSKDPIEHKDLKKLMTKDNPVAYQLYAHLSQAKVYVLAEEYSDAIAELNWVLTQSSIDQAIKQLSALRVARIHLELKQPEQAISVLTKQTYDPSFDAERLTVLGRAYTMHGDNLKARTSYEEAFKISKEDDFNAMITNLRHDLIVSNSISHSDNTD